MSDRLWMVTDDFDSSHDPSIFLHRTIGGAKATARRLIEECYTDTDDDRLTEKAAHAIADIDAITSEASGTFNVEYAEEQWLSITQIEVGD